jgi:hypothetical protein
MGDQTRQRVKMETELVLLIQQAQERVVLAEELFVVEVVEVVP